MSQRYAKHTKVSVARSEAALKELLRRYGADAIMTYEERRPQARAAVAFTMHGRNVKLSLDLPDPHADEYSLTETGRERSDDARHRAWEQGCRARWRLLVLLTQAKLEAIEAGASTFDREFLADIMLPSGETFSEAVSSGRADKLLGNGKVSLLPAPGDG